MHILTHLLRGSWERWITQNEIRGALQEDGSFERDADTGLPAISYQGKLAIDGRSPDGDDFDASLSDWTIEDVSGSSILLRFRLELLSSQEITDDDLDDYTPIRALLAWLEDVRVSAISDAVGTDATEDDTFGNTRVFSFLQDPGDSSYFSMEFNFLFERVYDSGGDNVLLYVVEFEKTTGSAAELDTDKIRDLFESSTVTISNTDEVTESGEIGGYGSVGKFKEVRLGSDDLILKAVSGGGFTLTGRDENGNLYTILQASDRNRTVKFSDLPTPTGQSYKTLTGIERLDTIHYPNSEVNDGTFRIPNPSILVGQEGTHRKIGFHNLSETYALEIEDWDGNTLIILSRGEFAEFQATLEGNGNGGKLIGLPSIRNRRLDWKQSFSSVASFPNFADKMRWNDSNREIRLIPITNSPSYQNTDAFEVFTATPPTTLQGALSNEDNLEFEGVVQILREGRLHFNISVDLYIANGVIRFSRKCYGYPSV